MIKVTPWGLLGGIGRHNRLKICRPKDVPVRVRQRAPYFLNIPARLNQDVISIRFRDTS